MTDKNVCPTLGADAHLANRVDHLAVFNDQRVAHSGDAANGADNQDRAKQNPLEGQCAAALGTLFSHRGTRKCEISNHKHHRPNKSEARRAEFMKQAGLFSILRLWNLFVICDLALGAYSLVATELMEKVLPVKSMPYASRMFRIG